MARVQTNDQHPSEREVQLDQAQWRDEASEGSQPGEIAEGLSEVPTGNKITFMVHQPRAQRGARQYEAIRKCPYLWT